MHNLEFKMVDFNNFPLAITVQKEIFPEEDGSLNILASLDRDLFNNLTSLDYIDDHIKYYLAYNKNAPVGITGFYYYPDYKEEMWLAWFGVIPKYRNKGYAMEILNWSISKAKNDGKKVLRLYTDAIENADAIKLYKKTGFEGIKYTSEILPYDCYIYSKNLTDENIIWDKRNLGLSKQTGLQTINNQLKKEIYNKYLEIQKAG